MFGKGANIITYYEITISKREEHTMDYRQEFSKLMAETSDLALATVSGDAPNVRIINFIWDEADKVLYFSTFLGTPKIAELAKNGKVSFITVPPQNSRAFVRATEATALPSAKPMAEMRETFVHKYPFFAQMFDMGIDQFRLYEVRFDKAVVNLGFGDFGEVTV